MLFSYAGRPLLTRRDLPQDHGDARKAVASERPRTSKATFALDLGRVDLWVLGVVLLQAVLWSGWSVLHGYGTDIDTYSMLRVWQGLVSQHAYVPSRFQGGGLAELTIGAAAALGGARLSNLFVLGCATTGLLAFLQTLRLYGVERRALVAAAVLANGWWLVAGATSMDYMVAFAPFALGLLAMASGWEAVGVVLLAAAGGARIFYVALAELTVVWVMLDRRAPPARIAATAAAVFFVSGLFYLSVWFSAGLRLDWMTASRPLDQGFVGLAARFVYKLLSLFGATGWIALLAGLVFERRRSPSAPRGGAGSPSSFAIYAALVVLAHLLMLAWIPQEVSYALPAVPFAAALLAIAGRPLTLVALTVGELVACWVQLDPVWKWKRIDDPCHWERAARFAVGPHLASGPLAEEMEGRALGQRCGQAMVFYPFADPDRPLPTGGPGPHPVLPGPAPPTPPPAPASVYRPM